MTQRYNVQTDQDNEMTIDAENMDDAHLRLQDKWKKKMTNEFSDVIILTDTEERDGDVDLDRRIYRQTQNLTDDYKETEQT